MCRPAWGSLADLQLQIDTATTSCVAGVKHCAPPYLHQFAHSIKSFYGVRVENEQQKRQFRRLLKRRFIVTKPGSVRTSSLQPTKDLDIGPSDSPRSRRTVLCSTWLRRHHGFGSRDRSWHFHLTNLCVVVVHGVCVVIA